MAVIIVGMADLRVARDPDVLTTLGLGSCVGICLYDKAKKIGGLAHIMLPLSVNYPGQNRAKFADTGISDLINEMVKLGAGRTGLVAKIAGGAHMFATAGNDMLKVGERNSAATLEILRRLNIPILSNETGGSHGRTIELYTETGALKIRTVGFGEKIV
ncbi:MAG: chemotaxis protein CheD [Oscillospiraceae bacterium]|nr:chemotaxis protein CheD [Oscillospiraceae bacterium]